MYRINACLLLLALLCASYSLAKELTEIEVLASSPTRCTYEHAYDMYGAHCANLRLSKIPSLRSGLEILDFSENTLRELHADTLSSYTSIKYLYLADNKIYRIDEDALTSLTYLETLDLSKNVIIKLPNSIFQLPSLRKLYLSGNPLINLNSNDFAITTPIKAPLELLDLSDCNIKALPEWGALPQLIFYNISHNPLVSIESSHFAAMCNLRKVDLTESIDKIKICDIVPTITWFQAKQVYFHLGDYTRLNSAEYDNCPKDDVSEVLNATYHACKTEYLQVQNIKASRRTWLTIGGGLAGFLIGFILLLYVVHRRNVAQTKSMDQKKVRSEPNSDRYASAILLNDIS